MTRPLVKAVLVGTVILGGILGYVYWTAANRTPQAFFNSGKKYYDQKKFPEAIIQLLNAVNGDPKSRDSRYYLALSYLNRQEVTTAVGQLNSLLEIYPDDVEANLQLGRIYMTAGRTRPEFFRQAQELAEKILSKDPQNVAALVLSGDAGIGLHEFDSSVDLLERAITLDPKNSGAFVSLGTMRTFQKNYPEAEKAFLKGREANPKDIGTLISLGNYYRAVGDSNKAEAVFKDALAQYPANKSVYSQAVEFYFQAGRFDEIEKILKDAQAASPNDPTPTLTLASFYETRDRGTDARKLLFDLKAKFPDNVELAVRLATNLMPDQPVQARQEIDHIIKIDPKNPMGYVLLGELQFRAEQFDAAEATLGNDPALGSPFPQVHFLLGNIAALKGKLDQAQDHYQKALALNGQYLPARTALADIFRDKGAKLPTPREDDGKVLAAQPGNVPARLLKAALDLADKNYSEAEKELSALDKGTPGQRRCSTSNGHLLRCSR